MFSKTQASEFDELELKLVTVSICKSCTKMNAGVENTEEFRQAVTAQLCEARPDIDWRIEPSPCLKVCPLDRITMSLSLPDASDPSLFSTQLTMSREANVNSVVMEILNFVKNEK